MIADSVLNGGNSISMFRMRDVTVQNAAQEMTVVPKTTGARIQEIVNNPTDGPDSRLPIVSLSPPVS